MTKKQGRGTKSSSNKAVCKEIRISKSGTCAKTEISKSREDEVRWISDYGPWVIHFRRSPFSGNDFGVPKGKKSKWSGRATTKTLGKYPYDVNGAGASADPNIIVKG